MSLKDLSVLLYSKLYMPTFFDAIISRAKPKQNLGLSGFAAFLVNQHLQPTLRHPRAQHSDYASVFWNRLHSISASLIKAIQDNFCLGCM